MQLFVGLYTVCMCLYVLTVYSMYFAICYSIRMNSNSSSLRVSSVSSLCLYLCLSHTQSRTHTLALFSTVALPNFFFKTRKISESFIISFCMNSNNFSLFSVNPMKVLCWFFLIELWKKLNKYFN